MVVHSAGIPDSTGGKLVLQSLFARIKPPEIWQKFGVRSIDFYFCGYENSASWPDLCGLSIPAHTIMSPPGAMSGKRSFAMIRTGRYLLKLFSRAVEQFHLRLHGYVLMDNHYHFCRQEFGVRSIDFYFWGIWGQVFTLAISTSLRLHSLQRQIAKGGDITEACA